MTTTHDSTAVGPPAPDPSTGGKGLKGGALGLASSVAIGLASAAPAYSVAATLGLVVAGVGLQSPVVMILAFLPMLLIAYGYRELNESDPDCGTTFTWATRAFGPRTGWMGGWGIIVADVIVMSNLAQIAGQYGFELVGADGLAASTGWTTVAGVLWIVLMTWLCYVGIELSASLQKVLLAVEVLLLAALSVTALVRVYSGHGTAGSVHVDVSWFNPLNIDSAGAFTQGILAAIFIYWGWDTAVSVNEETKDSTRTPGRAAVISTVLLLLIYTVVSTSAQSFAGVGTDGGGLADPDTAGDVLSSLGSAVFGDSGLGAFMAKLLIFMVLTSSAASTQTSILPTARTTLSMAVHKAIPARFARVHTTYLTPTWSTVGMGAASVVVYVVLATTSTAVLSDSIGSVGLGIAFYYALTGYACVWYYRKVLTRSARDLWFKGVLPLVGALTLTALFVYAAFFVYADPAYGTGSFTLPLLGEVGRVSVIGIGTLALGLVVMSVYAAKRPAFFRGRTLATSAADPSAPEADRTDPATVSGSPG